MTCGPWLLLLVQLQVAAVAAVAATPSRLTRPEDEVTPRWTIEGDPRNTKSDVIAASAEVPSSPSTPLPGTPNNLILAQGHNLKNLDENLVPPDVKVEHVSSATGSLSLSESTDPLIAPSVFSADVSDSGRTHPSSLAKVSAPIRSSDRTNSVSDYEGAETPIRSSLGSHSESENSAGGYVRPLSVNLVTSAENSKKPRRPSAVMASSSSPLLNAMRSKDNNASVAPGDVSKATNISSVTDTDSIISRWRKLEREARERMDSVLRKALPKIMEFRGRVNMTGPCKAAIVQLVAGLRGLKSWAVKMVDASGRFPSGSLDGTLTDFGDYDECLQLHYSSRNRRSEIKGQYCTLELKPMLPAQGQKVNLNARVLDFGNSSKDSVLSDLSGASFLFRFMVLHLGVCVPSMCSARDIQELAAAVVKKFPVNVSVTRCEVKQSIHLSAKQVVVIVLMSTVGLLMLMGTLMDRNFIGNGQKPLRKGRMAASVRAFSVPANIQQLMETSGGQSTLRSVNGIRCLSLLWIVLAHTYGFGHRQGLGGVAAALIEHGILIDVYRSHVILMNSCCAKRRLVRCIHRWLQKVSEQFTSAQLVTSTYLKKTDTPTFNIYHHGEARLNHARKYLEDISFQIITNAWVSVDTFFMLGGLLVAMSNLKAMERTKGRIDFISHVMHRAWRLTPPVAATVGVMLLLPLIGSGPLWADMAGKKVANCEENWWKPLLPINTWQQFDTMCLLHTWYVAADLHFYCLAPLILVLLFRWPALGFFSIFLMTALCFLAVGMLTIHFNLPPTVIFFSPDIELTKRTADLIYFRPYPHMGAYAVGIILGYVLWKYRQVAISWILQLVGWCASVMSCVVVLLATYPWSHGQVPTAAAGVTYAVLHRTAWAAGVAWVVFMCATKRAGVVNRFLSCRLFLPLSRLCYSVYLLHFPVLWVRVSWRRTLLNFRHYDLVTEYCGILVITLVLSLFFHIAFEAPFLKLENIWFPKRTENKEKLTEQKSVT